MAIQANCPKCSALLEVDDIYAGKLARCPKCEESFKLPEKSTTKFSLSESSSAEQTEAATIAQQDEYFLRSSDQKVYGPVAKETIEQWIIEGRVSQKCDLRESKDDPWQAASIFYPVLALPESMALGNPFGVATVTKSETKFAQMPHRAGLVLTLGLLGCTFICPLFCLLAWVIGSMDLVEMGSGRMDQSGEKLTKVGYFLGMFCSLIWILIIAGLLFVTVLAGIF